MTRTLVGLDFFHSPSTPAASSALERMGNGDWGGRCTYINLVYGTLDPSSAPKVEAGLGGGISVSRFFFASLVSLLVPPMNWFAYSRLVFLPLLCLRRRCWSLWHWTWRFAYQHEVKSGCCLAPTDVFWLFSSSWGASCDDLGYLAVLEASESSLSSNVMVIGDLLQPGHSTLTKHVGFDVLPKTATKNCVSWLRGVGFKLHTLTMGGEEDQEEVTRTRVQFIFFRGCICKKRAVITKKKYE